MGATRREEVIKLNKKSLSFNISNLKFELSNRSNWMSFSGTCLFTDVPSDGIPSGGIDKPVAFPRDEVQKALSTMQDMGVNCEFPDDLFDCPDEIFTGHNPRFKIGVVKTSELNGNEMVISGGLWDMDFPDVCDVFKNAKKSLGFSVEVLFNLVDAGEYYNATDIEFIGVATLFADLAAFKKTYIAAKDKNKSKGGNKHMELTKEELQAMLDGLYGKFENKFNELKTDQEKNNTQIEQLAVAFAEQKAKEEAKEAEEKQQAELAAAKAEEERIAKEAEEKAKAELAEKQKKEAEELEVQRKSVAFGNIHQRFQGSNDKQKAILGDAKLSPSEQFQKLLTVREAE